MQGKTTVIAAATLAVAVAGLVGWQSWNTHRLQQEISALQQQLSSQGLDAAPQVNPQLLAPGTVRGTVPPASLPDPVPQNLPAPADPMWGSSDPFADMQRMQAQMHQRMQQLMDEFGMPGFGASLFDEPFDNMLGFGSSMGFGADPEFSLDETAESYQVSIIIPEGSDVEITTELNGRDLTIEGKVTLQQQEQQGRGGYRSLQTRQFARTLTLPADVDPLGISNETRDGQVIITLPKQQNSLSSQPSVAAPRV